MHPVSTRTATVTAVTITDAIDAFLRLEMIGLSEQTCDWYRKRLGELRRYLGPDRDLNTVMEVDLEEYRAHLARRPNRGMRKTPRLSAYTLHGHVRAIRRFFAWLYRRELVSVDLSRNLKLPRLPRQGEKGISESNLKAILDAARGNRRDYALLRFLESTGVRRGGIEALRLCDLNLDQPDQNLRRRANVREKGGSSRTVIMSRATLVAMLAWLDARPQVDDDHVFLGRSNGRPWRALSAGGISQIISRYKKRLGLRGDCSPHQWRHRWARRHLHLGMELGQVSQLMGHRDVSITVQYYGQFSLDRLQEAYDRFDIEDCKAGDS